MCWSRGLAISVWRSLAGLSVCLSVWAVRDVSTPNVGSGVEAGWREKEIRLRLRATLCDGGDQSAADAARIRPSPRPTGVWPSGGTSVRCVSRGESGPLKNYSSATHERYASVVSPEKPSRMWCSLLAATAKLEPDELLARVREQPGRSLSLIHI